MENQRNPAANDCTDIYYIQYQSQWLVRGKIFVGMGHMYIYLDALPTKEEVNAIYPEAYRKD